MESALYMRNQLLRDSDWAGMAHSLEIRVPMVDTELLRRLGPALQQRGFRQEETRRYKPKTATARIGHQSFQDRFLHTDV